MRADELRIGNYLKRDVFLKVNAQTIVDIWEKKKNYEPIPITEDWIIRFGFEMFDYLLDEDEEDDFTYIDYRLPFKNKRFYYTLCTSREAFFDFCLKLTWVTDAIMLVRIKYVHELQNVYFALTGEELRDNGWVVGY
jgi:hypothetical protein